MTLQKGKNVAIFRSANGLSKFDIFMRRRSIDRPRNRLICRPSKTNISEEEIDIESMKNINFNNVSVPDGDANLYAHRIKPSYSDGIIA